MTLLDSLGVIGTGAMGSALIRGFIKEGLLEPSSILAFDVDSAKLWSLRDELGISAMSSGQEVVRQAGTTLLAVKPQVIEPVLRDIAGAIDSSKYLISIVTGVPLSAYRDITGKDFPVARVMPNTPALVGAGVSCACFNELVSDDQKEICLSLMRGVGSAHEVPEKYLDAVTGLSGSGPAYVFYFLDGMIDGGVKMGLPRNLARALAIDTIAGAIKLVKETGKHPMVLKDQVTSPGGTTVEALHVLDNMNLRGAIVSAVEAATEKSRKLSKK